MMKKLSFSLILLGLILSACAPTQTETPASVEGEAFELYLVADPQMSGGDLQRYALDDLPLAEDPIITTDDLHSYLWDVHAVNLTEEAYKKLLVIFSQGLPMSGLPFVIVSNGERIYAGAFWTPASSLSFDGVTILQPFDPSGQPLLISLGYPTSDFYTGDDPRNDSRLETALENAGLMK